MVASPGSGNLLGRLLAASCERQGIEPGRLTLDADLCSVVEVDPRLLDSRSASLLVNYPVGADHRAIDTLALRALR